MSARPLSAWAEMSAGTPASATATKTARWILIDEPAAKSPMSLSNAGRWSLYTARLRQAIPLLTIYPPTNRTRRQRAASNEVRRVCRNTCATVPTVAIVNPSSTGRFTTTTVICCKRWAMQRADVVENLLSIREATTHSPPCGSVRYSAVMRALGDRPERPPSLAGQPSPGESSIGLGRGRSVGRTIRGMFGSALPCVGCRRPSRRRQPALRELGAAPSTAFVEDSWVSVPLQNSLVPRKRQGFAM